MGISSEGLSIINLTSKRAGFNITRGRGLLKYTEYTVIGNKVMKAKVWKLCLRPLNL